MNTVAIIDYGMGNINSIKNMLRYIGHDGFLTHNENEILKADKIILPGVGNFKNAMENIKGLQLDDILEEAAVKKQIPLLGICLGMQLLLTHSEEGDCDGLNLIPGTVKKFSFSDDSLKIPHMGWDYINSLSRSALTKGFDEQSRFYFVHSYYVECENRANCIAQTHYGISFDSIIQKEKIYGTQFHPEKSHRFGMQLLTNFIQEA